MDVSLVEGLPDAAARLPAIAEDERTRLAVRDAGRQAVRTVQQLETFVDGNGRTRKVVAPLADRVRRPTEGLEKLLRRIPPRLVLIEAIPRAHHLQVGLLGLANRRRIAVRPGLRQLDLVDEVEAGAGLQHLLRIDDADLRVHVQSASSSARMRSATFAAASPCSTDPFSAKKAVSFSP